MKEQAELAEDIANGNGGEGFQFALEPETRSRLWEARHNAWYVARKRVTVHTESV